MSKSKDIDIYSNGITRSSRECEERRTIGLELTKLQKKLVIKFHGEYIRHKNRWLAITYSHNSQVNTLPVPTKHVSSAQHIKIKNFDNEKKKNPFWKMGWNLRMEDGWKRMTSWAWRYREETMWWRSCRPTPPQPIRTTGIVFIFFFFSGLQLQRLLLAVSSF